MKDKLFYEHARKVANSHLERARQADRAKKDYDKEVERIWKGFSSEFDSLKDEVGKRFDELLGELIPEMNKELRGLKSQNDGEIIGLEYEVRGYIEKRHFNFIIDINGIKTENGSFPERNYLDCYNKVFYKVLYSETRDKRFSEFMAKYGRIPFQRKI